MGREPSSGLGRCSKRAECKATEQVDAAASGLYALPGEFRTYASPRLITMPIVLDKIGHKTEGHLHRYNWRDQAIYALGIGAKASELDHLYENTPGGMKTFPTYVVVPAFEPVSKLMSAAGIELRQIVHGGQTVTTHRPLPSEGCIETTATLEAVYDLKRFAQAILSTESSVDGQLISTTEWSIIVMGEGGFGGPRPPARKVPGFDKDAQATWSRTEQTSAEQALLYRLSGDTNPLHVDHEVAREAGFEQGPILHGLCTYGHIARAVIGEQCGGDASRLEQLSLQFSKPVWPGEKLVTEGFDLGDGTVALRAFVPERDQAVVTKAWAKVR